MVSVIHVREEEVSQEWRDFVQGSNNGTLFHDLDFLAYHPLGRFDTHHLMFKSGQDAVALMPAAVVVEPDGRRVLKSPYGASVGGPVTHMGQPLDTTLELVRAMQEYAVHLGVSGIELRLGPSLYMRQPDDHLAFALTASGFELRCRWLCSVMPLPSVRTDITGLFCKTKAYEVRSALRRGLCASRVHLDRADEFYDILLENKANHQALPTHSLEEVKDLLRRLPHQVRLYLCEQDGRALAGVLLFVLNDRVAYTFYICQRNESKALSPMPLIIYYVAGELVTEGCRYLDLGPSTDDEMRPNVGVWGFKAMLGARGFCRDSWLWQRDNGEGL